MSIKDNDRTARKAYKKKIETVRVELYPTDADIKARIAERLEAGEGKATYIKRLIREDIQRAAFYEKHPYNAVSVELNKKGEIIKINPVVKDG